jgi:hypothetical protein
LVTKPHYKAKMNNRSLLSAVSAQQLLFNDWNDLLPHFFPAHEGFEIVPAHNHHMILDVWRGVRGSVQQLVLSVHFLPAPWQNSDIDTMLNYCLPRMTDGFPAILVWAKAADDINIWEFGPDVGFTGVAQWDNGGLYRRGIPYRTYVARDPAAPDGTTNSFLTRVLNWIRYAR